MSCSPTEEHLWIQGSHNRQLCATITKAQKASDAVIILHGWGGTRCGPHRLFTRLAARLAQNGITTLRFDFSGRGESDGSPDSVNLDDMIEDCRQASSYLESEYKLPLTGIIGMCSGGNVAIGAGTIFAQQPKLALVSTMPFSARSKSASRNKQLHFLGHYIKKACSLNTWMRLFKGEINTGGVARTLSQSGSENKDKRKLKDSTRDIMKDFRNYSAPCLFVYGSEDPEAMDASAHYKEFCTSNRISSQFTFIEGANHNFYRASWSTNMEESITDFLSAK